MSRRRRAEPGLCGGFTLIEVLVALVIVAFGMGAVLAALSNGAANASTLREKSNAEWVALNLIADERLSLQQISMGTVEGDIKNFANGNWHWQRQVNPVQGVPGMALITVSVRRTGDATNPTTPGPNPGSTAGPGSATTGTNATNLIGAGAMHIGNSASGSGSGGLSSAGGLGVTWGLGASTTVTVTTSSTLSASTIGAPSSLAPQAPLGTPSAAGAPLSLGANAMRTASSQRADAHSSDQSWLVTMIGFRGTALAASSGQAPDWGGSTFTNNNGANGNGTTPNTAPGVTAPNPGSPSPGASASPGAGSALNNAGQTPP